MSGWDEVDAADARNDADTLKSENASLRVRLEEAEQEIRQAHSILDEREVPPDTLLPARVMRGMKIREARFAVAERLAEAAKDCLTNWGAWGDHLGVCLRAQTAADRGVAGEDIPEVDCDCGQDALRAALAEWEEGKGQRG